MKENLFYLPPYEDEATAEKIREIYGYPIRYMKQYLLDFFTALYEEQHHIYVLLENLPLDYFAVERTYDRLLYWNNRNGSHEVDGWLYPRERYTLKEFLAKKRTFHRIDEFELVALGTSFTNSKAELPSQKLLKQLYMKFLQEQCERHLRLNTPIRLTPEIINRYGLTKWDAGKIRPYINRFNRKAKTKIRAEFDKLAALDFTAKNSKNPAQNDTIPYHTAEHARRNHIVGRRRAVRREIYRDGSGSEIW